jgi:hypothetical protein
MYTRVINFSFLLPTLEYKLSYYDISMGLKTLVREVNETFPKFYIMLQG